GSVKIENRSGDVVADTGSGSVTLTGIRGKVLADTGSGSVTVRDIVGDVEADTGSGGVTLENVQGNISADTGSGGVQGSGLSEVKRLRVDTGSGSVRLEGDFSALEDMEIDTGSGGATLRVAGTLNMRLHVSTGAVRARAAGVCRAIAAPGGPWESPPVPAARRCASQARSACACAYRRARAVCVSNCRK